MSDVPTAGHVPALVTPLDADGGADLDTFEKLVVRAFEHGAAAVLVAGSTGEGPLVPARTRADLVAAAAAVADGRSVLACVSGGSLEDVHADVERVVGAGATGVLALAPSYFRLSPREHAAAQSAIAGSAPVPLLVYHIPQQTDLALDPVAVADLAHHPNVAGMKDSSGDLDGLRSFIEVADGQAFAVFQGNGPKVLAALDAGAAGSITAIANLRPDLVATVHTAFIAGDRGTAEAAQTELTRLSVALAAVPAPLAVAVKAAMYLEGLVPDPTPTQPLGPLDAAVLEALRTALVPPDGGTAPAAP